MNDVWIVYKEVDVGVTYMNEVQGVFTEDKVNKELEKLEKEFPTDSFFAEKYELNVPKTI